MTDDDFWQLMNLPVDLRCKCQRRLGIKCDRHRLIPDAEACPWFDARACQWFKAFKVPPERLLVAGPG